MSASLSPSTSMSTEAAAEAFFALPNVLTILDLKSPQTNNRAIAPSSASPLSSEAQSLPSPISPASPALSPAIALSYLVRLSASASKGELRDYDSLFQSKEFYASLSQCLRVSWRLFDYQVLGGDSSINSTRSHSLGLNSSPNSIVDSMAESGSGVPMMGTAAAANALGMSAHEAFEFERLYGHQLGLVGLVRSSASSTSRKQNIVDDEEDQAFAIDPSNSPAWQRLNAIYTIISRCILFPEFNVQLATTTPGAFDRAFIEQLLQRFDPKYKNTSSQFGFDTRTASNPASVAGIGGVAGTASRNISLTKLPGRGMPGPMASTIGIGLQSTEPDCPTPLELSILRGLTHSIYLKFFTLRPTIRHYMGEYLARFIRAGSRHPRGISEILAIYGAIAKGFSLPIADQHRDFLMRFIMPLHQPSQMINEFSPLIQSYHESLVYVLVQFLENDRNYQANLAPAPAKAPASKSSPFAALGGSQSSSLCEQIITRILQGWPSNKMVNSPKEVILIHEIEKLIEYCPPSATEGQINPSSHRILSNFLPLLVQSISSYNHRVAERALELWKNDIFLNLCRLDRQLVLPAVIPILINEEKHWNSSVNKMRSNVLTIFREMDLVLFARVVHMYYLSNPGDKGVPATPTASLARVDALIEYLKPPVVINRRAEELKLLETQIQVASSLPTNIEYREFVFGHLLGEGSFSQVRYAKKITKGELPSQWPEYAVKIIDKELVKNQNYEENIQREIKIMGLLAHENINRLVGLCSNPTNTYLVLEFAHKGDLHSHLSRMGSLSVDSARFISAEIVRALEEIHRNRIIYVDLKPENVLVHQSGHVKLSDFGSSRFFDETILNPVKSRLEGTADYVAPEILRGQSISPASDLWAFGCVLYQLLCGRPPLWLDEQDDRILAQQPTSQKSESGNKSNNSMDELEEEERLRKEEMDNHSDHQKAHLLSRMVAFENTTEDRYPEGFDAAARDLIDSILRADPIDRYSILRADVPAEATMGVQWMIDFGRLKLHPFFKGIDFDNLPRLQAPQIGGGTVATVDPNWSRRKNSIMWAPMPKSFAFSEASVALEALPENMAKEREGSPSASSGSTSLHSNIAQNSSLGLATGFGSLGTGLEPITDDGKGFTYNEEDEEDDDNSDDEPKVNYAGLRSALANPSGRSPFSVINGPHQPSQSSSRAPLKSILHSSNMPPHVSNVGLPRSRFSDMGFVPNADPTGGPTGLGMGLRGASGGRPSVPQQSSTSTASALLSRMKPPQMPPQSPK